MTIKKKTPTIKRVASAASKVVKLMEEGDHKIFMLVDSIKGENEHAVLVVVCGEYAEDLHARVLKSKAYRKLRPPRLHP